VGSCSGAGWSGATCSDGTAGRNRGTGAGKKKERMEKALTDGPGLSEEERESAGCVVLG
jgi:hypothetical protein